MPQTDAPMSDPVDLEMLALRCEQATEPDRELDGYIRKAVVGDFGHCGDDGWLCAACFVPSHELTQEPGCGVPMGLNDERHSYPSDWREDERLPAYTASLDAAMTLVPEGCLFSARTLWDGPETHGYAHVHTYSDDAANCDSKRHTGDYDGLAATTALALCAASLRARLKDTQG